MKKSLLATAILVAVAGLASAQWRADIGVDIPWTVGAEFSDAFGETDTDSVNVLSEITLLVPEVFIGYEAQLGLVNVGVGARVFTFIVQSLAYPAAFAEVDLGPLAVNLNLGGGAFLTFGLFNDIASGSVFIPDLSAHLKLGEAFRLGLGAASIASAEADGAITIVYLSGKFVVRF